MKQKKSLLLYSLKSIRLVYWKMSISLQTSQPPIKLDPSRVSTLFFLVQEGIKPPIEFGEKGADFIVGEAQHLAIEPNFGGPGLGIFGCRHNDTNKKDLRASPGRYIGKAKI